MKRLPLLVIALLVGLGLVLSTSQSAIAGKRGPKPVLLAGTNKAPGTTALVATGNGPALRLQTKAGRAPLAVSSSTKVVRLNADLVDGRDATALANDTRRYTFRHRPGRRT